MTPNLDTKTVAGFGDEWGEYDQTGVSKAELARAFERYFSIFPWDDLPPDAAGLDLGCGSGRWASFVAPRVGTLHCVDASEKALAVARRNLEGLPQCRFHLASVDSIPLANDSLDFAYSLGVLHHVPDTEAGIRSCVSKLKVGAPFLLYLYYAFDQRPGWFRRLWKASDLLRTRVAEMPHARKVRVTELIAATVYFPFARLARLVEWFGGNPDVLPLSHYRESSFYTMRTDALDRFGTRLEQRFTAVQIREMMEGAGLRDVEFREAEPFWCAIGFRGTHG